MTRCRNGVITGSHVQPLDSASTEENSKEEEPKEEEVLRHNLRRNRRGSSIINSFLTSPLPHSVHLRPPLPRSVPLSVTVKDFVLLLVLLFIVVRPILLFLFFTPVSSPPSRVFRTTRWDFQKPVTRLTLPSVTSRNSSPPVLDWVQYCRSEV